MRQKVVVYDSAAIVKGTLALEQALPGVIDSLAREPFLSAIFGYADVSQL